MPDVRLPKEPPLRSLFLDLNSYFASVEQAEDASLQGQPVAVVPLMADTTFCIAASYEAKAYGIKTGTRVDEARQRCPDLILKVARPSLYVAYHDEIVRVLGNIIPVQRVASIDEMEFGLMGSEQHPDRARAIAQTMKETIWREISPAMNCSIGVAPNGFLAKIATELQKPNGLVILDAAGRETMLPTLALTDWTGINRKMKARLNAAGIFSSADLLTAHRVMLRQAFGGIVGDRWYEWIRGAPQVEVKRPRQSLSHSNVLSPALRTDEGSYAILVRLTVKALARLRSHNLLTQRVQLHVKGMEKSWEIERRIPATQSTPAVLKVINELWERRDFARPLRVGVNLVDLVAPSEHTPSLFEDAFLNPADDTVDQLNARFGRHKVFLASIAHTKERAQERIAFQKTELFQEGGTQEPWVNTRNAERMAEGEEAGSSNLAPQ